MACWTYSLQIDNPIPVYYYQEEIHDCASIYYRLENKIASLFFQLHRFHLDFTDHSQRIKLRCDKAMSGYFEPLFKGCTKEEAERSVTYFELLASDTWKEKVEKIIRVCDQIQFISTPIRLKITEGFALNIKNTFFDEQCYTQMSYSQLSIYAFKLAMHRWKKEGKCVVPKVIQDKILDAFSPAGAEKNSFKEIYPILPRWECRIEILEKLRHLYLGTGDHFVDVWIRHVAMAQKPCTILGVTAKGIDAEFFQGVLSGHFFNTFKRDGSVILAFYPSEDPLEADAYTKCLKKITHVLRTAFPIDSVTMRKLDGLEEKI